MKTCVLLTLAILTLGTSATMAEVPKTISYQGVLADGSGNPSTDTSATLTFRIYSTGAGGTPIWEETMPVLLSNGLFTAILGSSTPLNLPFDQQYWGTLRRLEQFSSDRRETRVIWHRSAYYV